VWTERTIVEC